MAQKDGIKKKRLKDEQRKGNLAEMTEKVHPETAGKRENVVSEKQWEKSVSKSREWLEGKKTQPDLKMGQTLGQTSHQRRWTDGKYEKMAHHHTSSGDCKLKSQAPTTHPSVSRANLRSMTVHHAGQDAEPRGRSLTAGRNAKCGSHRGRQLGRFLQKLNLFFHSIQQSHFLLFAQRSWKLRSTPKPAHKVYSSFIHRCPNMEATTISGEQMDKQGKSTQWNVIQH